jgi:hypothetical protein
MIFHLGKTETATMGGLWSDGIFGFHLPFG